MNLQKSKRGRHSATEDHDDNTKRSKKDYSLAMTPKEVVLLERRLNDRQATTTRFLSNTNRTDCSGTMPQIQNNLSIPMSSSTSASVTQCESFPPLNALPKEKKVSYAFHVFEKGSTSETAAESCLPTLETLTTKGCLQYTGVVKTKKTTNNIKRLRSDYVELKKIPPCKFCNAKRF